MKLKKKIALILILLITKLTSLEAATITVDQILAVVNDEIITQTDVNRAEAAIAAELMSIDADPEVLSEKLKQVRKNIIGQMIEEKLVLSEAKRHQLQVDQARIDQRIEEIQNNFPSQERFEQALGAQGLSLKDLKQRFYNQELMRRAIDYFIRSRIKVDPVEMEQFYQAHQVELGSPEQAHVQCILTKAETPDDEYQALQAAKQALERLKQGEPFEELVTIYSQGANVEEGGDLGFIEQGQFIQEIDQAIFSLAPGEHTDVLKTPSGYRIFRVLEKKEKQIIPFSELQEKISKILYNQEFTQEFGEWMDKLKDEAYISIKSDEEK
ncbi:peptidylprolyl isomerase [Candidatus Omnitrophota bacterium]